MSEYQLADRVEIDVWCEKCETDEFVEVTQSGVYPLDITISCTKCGGYFGLWMKFEGRIWNEPRNGTVEVEATD